jgi:hypothetical protein
MPDGENDWGRSKEKAHVSFGAENGDVGVLAFQVPFPAISTRVAFATFAKDRAIPKVKISIKDFILIKSSSQFSITFDKK